MASTDGNMTPQEKKKESLLDAVWYQIKQVDVNIRYSSLFVEKNGKPKNLPYLKVASTIWSVSLTAFPILTGTGVLDATKLWVILVNAIIAIIPALFFWIWPSVLQAILIQGSKQCNDLLALNKKLTTYRGKLEGLYNEIISYNTFQEKFSEKFQSLNKEYLDEMEQHDKLTGKIDETLEKEAQKLNKEYMKIKFYHKK